MPPTKRIRISKREREEMEAEMEEAESEDEWAQERGQAQPGQGQDGRDTQGGSEDESESEEEEGFAQFESDQGEMEVDDENEDEEAVLSKQLSSIPFASLLKAKRKLSRSTAPASDSDNSENEDEDDVGNGGTRFGKEGAPLKSESERRKQSVRKNGSLRKVDRSSKHAPMEMSSKKAVGRTRTIVETAANRARDPRFDSLSGSFSPTLFKNSYSFLRDSQTSELEALRKTAKLVRGNVAVDEAEKEKVEKALMRMESREVERGRRERDEGALRGWKKEERTKRDSGKKEFWLKKCQLFLALGRLSRVLLLTSRRLPFSFPFVPPSFPFLTADQKAILLKAKYETLAQDKKGLRKAVEKKRRKTVQQDKKLLPAQRRSAA
ncbi:ribosomal RNA-processing protein 36, partial [Phenoliferia sp. Uapishka_3]